MPRKNKGLTADGKIRNKKADCAENGNFNLDVLKSRDKGKVMLRIDKNLIILVTPENCNENYATLYRKRMEESKL